MSTNTIQTMQEVLLRILKQQGPEGPLAKALVYSATTLLEISSLNTPQETLSNWAATRADAALKHIADGME